MRENFDTVYIVGPTASGKSRLALDVAKNTGGIIISADSMQIYRGLNIGTAKPTAEELADIEHRLIDIVDASEEFSVAQFKQAAENAVEEAHSEGKPAIVVGGTGLYFEALFYPMSFGGTSRDITVRQKLQEECEHMGGEWMLKRLSDVDPITAARLHARDIKRIIRALEVYEVTGKPISDTADMKPQYGEDDILAIGLSGDRKKLYERIDRRVDEMFEEGLVDEVFAVGNFAYQSMQAIGYKEFAAVERSGEGRPKFKEGELDAIRSAIKQHTRNYAKRQLTWFKRYPFVRWFDFEEPTLAKEYILSRMHT